MELPKNIENFFNAKYDGLGELETSNDDLTINIKYKGYFTLECVTYYKDTRQLKGIDYYPVDIIKSIIAYMEALS